MSDRHWSRDEVLALVQGRYVSCHSADYEYRPLPSWIRAGALGEISVDVETTQSTTHPDDRRALIGAYLEACAEVGAARSVRYRTAIRGTWAETTITFVNLSDHDDVRGILSAAEPGRPLDEPEMALSSSGDHDTRPWILGRLDANSAILEIEGKVRELIGRPPAEVIGQSPVDLMHPDSTGDSVSLWWRLMREPGSTATSRRCFVHPDGTEIWAEQTYLNRFGPEGKGDVLWMAHDITERRAQEQELRESHEEITRLATESRALAEDFRLLADEVPAAVFRCDADGTITFHNSRWTELLPDRRLANVVEVVDAVDRPRVREALERIVHGAGADRVTLEVFADEPDRVLLVTFRADGTGADRRVVGSIEDVTSAARLRSEARHDQLTGLLNRKGLEERLVEALADDPAGTLLVFFDLDGFKSINDVHGHDAGDLVLQELGARLARAVRPTDTVARYGGDEFVLVCTGVVDDGTDEGTTAIVQRLQLVLSTPILFHGGVWQPAASIGTARAVPGDDPSSLIRRADLEMFEAKRARYDGRRGHRAG